MATAPKETKVIIRLSEEQYNALKRQLTPTIVTSTTTPTQAAYQLGVAHVLELLRDGYVV